MFNIQHRDVMLCPPNGVALDLFLGSGTIMKVALELGRNCIGIELNPKHVKIIKKRVSSSR